MISSKIGFNILVSAAIVAAFSFSCMAQDMFVGDWNAKLVVNDDLALPFGLTIESKNDGLVATISNGPEKIPVDAILDSSGSRLTLDFPHYDSKIVCGVVESEHGLELQGSWKKFRGDDRLATVPFAADQRELDDFEKTDAFVGRFEVDFDGDEQTAVADFQPGKATRANSIHGTFLTTTGDYRFLGGGVKDNQLMLSCFDGAHAFLFVVDSTGEDQLEGEFYSGNWFQQDWKATRNDSAQLLDATELTQFNNDVDLSELSFRALNGQSFKLDSVIGQGKPYILEVFGTWCPNCHDAAIYLRSVQQQYGEKLGVLGLAFELSEDFERNVGQIEVYKSKFEIDYEILIAGPADKTQATESLGVLDRVRSYPTFIFVDAEGNPVGIYQGFSGPATGQAHERLKETIENKIKALLESAK